MAKTKQTTRKATGGVKHREKWKERPGATGVSDYQERNIVQPVITEAKDPRGLVGDAISVTISVGAKGHTFLLQRSILAVSSKVLRGMFSNESSISKGELANEDASIFNLYVNWLHSGVLATKIPALDQTLSLEGQDEEQVAPSSKKEDPEFVELTKLYILGKHLEDEDFANSVIDGFIGKIRETEGFGRAAEEVEAWLPGPTCIELIYNDTTGEDKLKELLVRLYSTEHDSDVILQQWVIERFRVEFRNDLLMELLPAIGMYHANRVVDESNCAFHVHAKGEKCDLADSRKRRRLV